MRLIAPVPAAKRRRTRWGGDVSTSSAPSDSATAPQSQAASADNGQTAAAPAPAGDSSAGGGEAGRRRSRWGSAQEKPAVPSDPALAAALAAGLTPEKAEILLRECASRAIAELRVCSSNEDRAAEQATGEPGR